LEKTPTTAGLMRNTNKGEKKDMSDNINSFFIFLDYFRLKGILNLLQPHKEDISFGNVFFAFVGVFTNNRTDSFVFDYQLVMSKYTC
jgi:hypothetical protein